VGRFAMPKAVRDVADEGRRPSHPPCTSSDAAQAVQREVIARNGGHRPQPCTLVDAPKAVEVDTGPLTADEARALLAVAAGRRNSARWAVAVALGLRQGEALGLRWKNVDLEKGEIKVDWQLKLQRSATDAMMRTRVAATGTDTRAHRTVPRPSGATAASTPAGSWSARRGARNTVVSA
jgi:integrase